MPEGPSILIMKEACLKFQGMKVLAAHGNAKIDFNKLVGKTIQDFRVWGKQTFIVLEKDLAVRIHLLMFGSYSIDDQTKPERSLRLCLEFENGKLYYYTCSVKIFEENLDKAFDFRADVLSDDFDPKRARKKLKAQPDILLCDALLDQDIFSGVGNIIKNEVLFRIRVHPETKIGALPPRKLTELIAEARHYSFDFLKWKKNSPLKNTGSCTPKRPARPANVRLRKTIVGKLNAVHFIVTPARSGTNRRTTKKRALHDAEPFVFRFI